MSIFSSASFYIFISPQSKTQMDEASVVTCILSCYLYTHISDCTCLLHNFILDLYVMCYISIQPSKLFSARSILTSSLVFKCSCSRILVPKQLMGQSVFTHK